MILHQLKKRGIASLAVLQAMVRVPREKFVAKELQQQAYADRALPIGESQTISQPYIVALMTELLDVQPNDRILEIGTGSGYQTAILAEMGAEIVSIERHASLSAQAGKTLSECGYENITLVTGDGSLGWTPSAPYDRILLTAASQKVPEKLLEQLADPGTLVGPFGDRQSQMIQVLRKKNRHITSEHGTPCRFVPLIGEAGFSKTEAE